MKLLKVKVKVYQYTGLYLAQKEENEFLKSKVFWEKFERNQRLNKNQGYFYEDRDLQKSLLFRWRHKNMFRRPVSTLFYLEESMPAKLVQWCDKFYLQLKFDASNLFKVVVEKCSL